MMKRPLLALLLSLFAIAAHAQGYQGHDFWICFPQNAIYEQGAGIQLTLHITSDSRTTGVIQPMDDTTKYPFSVESGAEISVEVDTTLEIMSSAEVERKSLHVTSDHDITLYAVNHRKASTDSYAAIPTPLLGMEYVVAGYSTLRNNAGHGFTSQAEIIATEDSTMVTAHLAAAILGGQPAGRSLMFVLNRGDVFQLQGDGMGERSDLTGTIVTATKPVAFFTGHRCAQVPSDVRFCDMLLEEEPPANDWGKEFVVTKFEGKDFSVARVIARSDSTQVFVNGKLTASLQKGGYCEIDTLRHDAAIRTSKPALVAQYSTSSDADTIKIGDPFMLLVVPNDRFLTDITTASVTTGQWYHYLNIVVPDSAIESLRLDGQRKPLFMSRNKVTKQLSVVRIEVEVGRHEVTCAAPIAVYSYGFGMMNENYDSYGHACGMRLDTKK